MICSQDSSFLTGVRDLPYFKIDNMEEVDIELKGPIDLVDRLRNVPVKMGVRFMMRTHLKQMMINMVSQAAHSAIKGMIDKSKSS